MPWGNLLCSGSILFSGSSPAKAITFLRQMGVLTMSKRTYHRIQEAYLIPSVSSVWNSQQKNLLNIMCHLTFKHQAFLLSRRPTGIKLSTDVAYLNTLCGRGDHHGGLQATVPPC